MSKLWEPKETWHRFDPDSAEDMNRIAFVDFFEECLPYERLYDTLTQEELLELLRDAKRLHWEALDLQNCGLDTLPEELGELTDLKLLWASNGWILEESNTFTIIPDSVGNLTKLNVLNLTRVSVIPILPDSLKLLRDLRVLALGGTGLTALPERIGNLTNLKELYIHDTQILTLPQSMEKLSALQGLDIRDTPLEKRIPPEIRKHSPRNIIRYVLDMQSNKPKKYFNESKMVIAGQARMGKTCLLERLVKGTYTDNPTTEGIDIEKWEFQRDGEKYTLNVWDFGGQEIYHGTHQFFLTRRTLYLLVWDVQAEDEYGRIDYWLRTIQSLGGDSPILLIANKCDKDLGRYQKIRNALMDQYPQIQGIYYVSCRDNIGIDELREDVEKLAVKLPLMRTEWLERWLDVRGRLEKLSETRNYITYEKYLELCAERGVAEEEAGRLIQYLHDLGIVLYYREDALLKTVVILSPEWGTDAVYKVLDHQERVLKGRNGVLRYDDLPKIWEDAVRYPPRMHHHLLHLMERFGLAFRLDSPEQPPDTYLVAELLGQNPVRPPADWDAALSTGVLRFRYNYDFMPAGVMTRLIVSIHELLDGAPGGTKRCWREGAYLRQEYAQAKLQLYSGIDRRFIDITAAGGDPYARQNLLAAVRDHISRINARFNKIVITELVPCQCPRCTGAEEPYFFPYETLRNAAAGGRTVLPCYKSMEDVPIAKLLEGVKPLPKEDYGGYDRDGRNRPYPLRPNPNPPEPPKPPELPKPEDGKSLWGSIKDALESFKTLLVILAIAAFAGVLLYLLSRGELHLSDLPGLFGNLPG